MGDTLDLGEKENKKNCRARPGICFQHKAIYFSLPPLDIGLSRTHRAKRLILEMRSPTDLSADGKFLPFFQLDIPPMLLRTPLPGPLPNQACPFPSFKNFLGHPCILIGH
jgi:hypothetical protein